MAEGAGEGRSQILLVEDDGDTRQMLAMGLELGGYSVRIAENGLEALELLRCAEPLPALMLLDLMMPKMDGFEVLAHLGGNSRLATLPVMLLSGDEQSCRSERAARAVGYLRKPVGLPELLAAVSRFVRPAEVEK